MLVSSCFWYFQILLKWLVARNPKCATNNISPFFSPGQSFNRWSIEWCSLDQQCSCNSECPGWGRSEPTIRLLALYCYSAGNLQYCKILNRRADLETYNMIVILKSLQHIVCFLTQIFDIFCGIVFRTTWCRWLPP